MGGHLRRGGARAATQLVRSLFGFAVAVALSAGSLAPAHAATDEIPLDVQAAFSDDALAALRQSEESPSADGETGGSEFTGATSFGAPRQVHLWSSDLILGKSSDQPTTALDEWLAPILGPAGEPLGAYRVWRPTPESTAELAGYNNDIELAAALQKLDEVSVLVSDPTIEAWYAVRDRSVSAVNQSAAREVPYPTAIDEVALLVAERYGAAIADSEEVGEGAAGGMAVDDRRPWFYGMDPWILGAGSLLLLVAAWGGIWWARARRRVGDPAALP
ncbi:MAG: hypothetical protein C0444_07560 [Microbacterium sp.]|nr:hypothetical protein [Microbacterium sp.]MBA4346117.1 hypothetical protein [Microbacterium sp.]